VGRGEVQRGFDGEEARLVEVCAVWTGCGGGCSRGWRTSKAKWNPTKRSGAKARQAGQSRGVWRTRRRSRRRQRKAKQPICLLSRTKHRSRVVSCRCRVACRVVSCCTCTMWTRTEGEQCCVRRGRRVKHVVVDCFGARTIPIFSSRILVAYGHVVCMHTLVPTYPRVTRPRPALLDKRDRGRVS
jgi:hypothetical protein